MAGLLSFGAGVSDGLDKLLQQQLEERHMKLLEEQLANAQSNQQGELAYRNRSLDLLDQDRRDRLAETDKGVMRQMADETPIGGEVSPAEMAKYTQAGIPSGRFQTTPGKPVESMIGLMSLPGDGPIQSQSVVTQDAASPLAAPPTIKNLGTQAQQQVVAGNDSKAADREARISHLMDQASQMWEKIRLEGDNSQTRAALATASQALEQAKTKALIDKGESDRELSQAKLDAHGNQPVGAPILTHDGNGGYVLHVYHGDGSLSHIPLPAGQTPVKAAPPSFLDRLGSLFGGSSSSAGDIVDPSELK